MRVLIQTNPNDREEPYWAIPYMETIRALGGAIKKKITKFVEPEVVLDCDHDFNVVGKYTNGTFEIRCSKCYDSYVIPEWQK